MKQVIVEQFGGPEQLKVVELPTPEPGPGQVRIRVTSIGMNHAELMGRRGEYRLSTGEPPFTPGLEAGGVLDALGPGVSDRQLGQRVVLGADAPRLAAPGGGGGGTYRSHYICAAAQAIPAPDALPDDQLGALWLAYLTAWGCLVWKQRLHAGQIVALPAASSSVALAAAQIAKKLGATTIGLTTSQNKIETIRNIPACSYDHLVLTHDDRRQMLPWYKDIKRIAGDRGVDVFFDAVAAGSYLETEIRCLAQHGCIYIYGLLGEPDKVNVHALIRKFGMIYGWALAELVAAGPSAFEAGYTHILNGFADGSYRQHVGRVFRLDDVQEAHRYMEQGQHVGKLVLVP